MKAQVIFSFFILVFLAFGAWGGYTAYHMAHEILVIGTSDEKIVIFSGLFLGVVTSLFLTNAAIQLWHDHSSEVSR